MWGFRLIVTYMTHNTTHIGLITAMLKKDMNTSIVGDLIKAKYSFSQSLFTGLVELKSMTLIVIVCHIICGTK